MRQLRRRLLDADLRLFRRIAGWRSYAYLRPIRPLPPTRTERGMRLLTTSANMSRLWLGIAATLFGVGGRSGKRAALRGIGSIGVTSFVINLLIKPFVRRRRPDLRFVPDTRRLARQPTTTSFPSGHAASAAAFATGVALEMPGAGAAVAPLAAGVAYSRTYTGVHYPSDVVVGAAIGTGIAWALRRVWPASAVDAPGAARLRRVPALPASDDGEGVAIVVNPRSGTGLDPARPDIDDVRTLLPEARVIEVGDLGPRRAASEAAGAPIMGVSAGDGTLAATAAEALRRKRPLLVMPGGTMNHFAHDIGIEDAAAAAAALSRGHGAAADIASIDGHAFVNNATLGAHTRMVDERERLRPRIGRWPAQILAALRVLWSADPVEVTIDGRPTSVWMAFIGNGIYHDRGIAPGWRDSLADGLLDVRILERRGSRLRGVMELLASGTGRGLRRMRARELAIDPAETTLRVAYDGEPLEVSGRIVVRSHPGGLRVYAPEQG